LEAKYWHLPINHFHGGIQRVKGKVGGFTELKDKRLSIDALMKIESQGENNPGFQHKKMLPDCTLNVLVVQQFGHLLLVKPGYGVLRPARWRLGSAFEPA